MKDELLENAEEACRKAIEQRNALMLVMDDLLDNFKRFGHAGIAALSNAQNLCNKIRKGDA